MNWASVSFDWNQARAFLATVEEGSLSAAALVLGTTQPTVSRQVAALEEKLGILLFERAGKNLVLTGSGTELLDHVRAMFEAANNISLAASGQSQAIEGLVRITASDVMAAHLLLPAIARMREAAPLVEFDIVASNSIQNLQMREADIAVRHVRPEQPDLIARFIADARAHFYASTAYLDRKGRPASLQDLNGHDWIGFSDNETLIDNLNPLGLGLTGNNFKVGSANGVVAWEMARSGLGIIVMAEEVGTPAPGMERVMPDMDPLEYPVWLTAHRELLTSRRIRLAFDMLAENLLAIFR